MHGKILQQLTKSIIVPLCKNKIDDISDAANYIPVSLAITISILFEH